MSWKLLLRTFLMFAPLLPGVGSALVVEIQGVRMEPDMAGASCVDIAGVYPGVKIEADEPGQTPRICSNSARVNSIHIANATLIAQMPIRRDVVIKFENEFPPGVNGKIVARTRLQGFFANEDGVGVPTGDQMTVRSYFAQGLLQDLIAEPFIFTVGDTFESAVFDYSVKKTYLAAGPRALKAEIRVNFTGKGHKLSFPDRCLVMLDTGARFEDRLETLEPADDGGGSDQTTPAPDSGETESPAAEAPAAPKESQPEAIPPLPRLPPLNAPAR